MTKKGKKFIWLLLTSLSLGILSGGKFLYLIFMTLSILILYSYYSIYKGKKNLYHFFWVSNRTLKVGESLNLGYKLNNTGILPIAHAEITCNISKRLGDMKFPVEYAFLSPLQMINIKKEVICRHRGYYKVGELHVKIKDFLNLFEKEIIFNKNIDLIVYPVIHDINNMKLPATEYFGAFRVPYNTHEDYTSIKNIREYVEGDNVKKVHWKLSARLGTPYVKEYELSANTKINIFLDAYEGSFIKDSSGDIEEKMVETGASIINYCLKNNLNTSLSFTAVEKTYIEGRYLNRLEGFLKELIGFQAKGKIPIYEFLSNEVRKLSYGSTLVILTSELNEKIFQTLISLRQRKFNPMLILVNEDKHRKAQERKMEEYIRKKGIETYRITPQSNIKKVLEVSSWILEDKEKAK
ncbi:DUF58 domain-containing protein [Wukongibacter baidiensis]|uniref:DUF58 domain-containing protein n=1 Tax=Wukongibacter baidiensis TaxID=1723361 RepID=UPI003D7F4357